MEYSVVFDINAATTFRRAIVLREWLPFAIGLKVLQGAGSKRVCIQL